MRFEQVRLQARASALPALERFYAERLGLEQRAGAFAVGETLLDFAPADADAFYHFALLAPGDRFDPLLAWARARVDLLPHPGTGEVVFDFSFWDAGACYFHDPAGNIVELIAHRGLGESGARGPFRARELLGLSELGLVGDVAELGRGLGRLGLPAWSGTLEGADAFAFVGEQARTLILAPPGRGWLPTGRPAEPHPVEATLGGAAGEVVLADGLYRLRGS